MTAAGKTMIVIEEFYRQIEDFIFAENEPAPADMIFLPGSREPHMARLAAELFRRGLAPRILPSGKWAIGQDRFQGPSFEKERYSGSYETEWEFLKEVLMEEKVPGEAILREDQAGYTWQNALFSRHILDRMDLIPDKALICCKTWHARRCLMYYQRAFPDTELIVVCASPDGITRQNWRQSEEGIRTVMDEARRIVTQFSLWMEQ